MDLRHILPRKTPRPLKQKHPATPHHSHTHGITTPPFHPTSNCSGNRPTSRTTSHARSPLTRTIPRTPPLSGELTAIIVSLNNIQIQIREVRSIALSGHDDCGGMLTRGVTPGYVC